MNLNKEVKYFVYARVSTKKQENDSDSLENQVYSCRDYISREYGEEVSKVFSEAYTGSKGSRPEFDKMLKEVRKSSLPVIVVVTSSDRFVRDVVNYPAMKEKLAKAGGTLVSTDGLIQAYSDMKNSQNFLLEMSQQMKSTVDLLETGEKTRRGLLASRQCGYRTSHPVLGYMNDILSPSKVHIIDGSNSVVIESVLTKLENGDFQSKTEVLEYLKECKIYNLKTKKEYVYKLELVNAILKNLSYYAGFIDVHGDGKELAKGLHKPLINKQQYEKIKCNTANFGRKFTSRTAIRKYTFSGLLVCEECGSRMHVSTTTAKGRDYPYYVCHNEGCAYHNKNIPAKKIEKAFFEYLKREDALLPLSKVNDIIDQKWLEHKQSVQREKGVAEHNINVNEKMVNRILDMVDPTLDDNTSYSKGLKKKLEKTMIESESLDETLKECQRKLSSAYKKSFYADLETAYKLCKSCWEAQDKEIVNQLVGHGRLTYHKSDGLLTFKPQEQEV